MSKNTIRLARKSHSMYRSMVPVLDALENHPDVVRVGVGPMCRAKKGGKGDGEVILRGYVESTRSYRVVSQLGSEKQAFFVEVYPSLRRRGVFEDFIGDLRVK